MNSGIKKSALCDHHTRFANLVSSPSVTEWWTYGESNSTLIHAMDAYYHYTIGPCLETLHFLLKNF